MILIQPFILITFLKLNMVKNILTFAVTLFVATIKANLIIQSPLSLRNKFHEG